MGNNVKNFIFIDCCSDLKRMRYPPMPLRMRINRIDMCGTNMAMKPANLFAMYAIAAVIRDMS